MSLITIRGLASALWPILVLLVLLSKSLLCSVSAQDHSTVCVVIRTYAGHGGQSQQGLQNLIRSLQRQQNQKWEAILVVLDGQPFSDLPHILQTLDDDRVWVFAEWVGPDYAARTGTSWAPLYHGMLYNLTDEAVRACPRSTQWVVMTNGDNEYSSTFFDELDKHAEADLIAMDYYSRYQRPTALPCQRFAGEQGKPFCKQNLARWCHTDLGANVYRWPKLIEENQRLGQLAPYACGLPSENYDGVLMHRLIDVGWRLEHVKDKCLYDHSPSPQGCARVGGVWDDSSSAQGFGGSCLTQGEADEKMQDPTGTLQEVIVRLSNDGHLDTWVAPNITMPLEIRCLRQQDIATQHAQMLDFFGPTCTPPTDEEFVKQQMGARWVPQDWSCIGLAQSVQLQFRKAMQQQQLDLQIPPPPDPMDKSRKPTYRLKFPLQSANPHEEL